MGIMNMLLPLKAGVFPNILIMTWSISVNGVGAGPQPVFCLSHACRCFLARIKDIVKIC